MKVVHTLNEVYALYAEAKKILSAIMSTRVVDSSLFRAWLNVILRRLSDNIPYILYKKQDMNKLFH